MAPENTSTNEGMKMEHEDAVRIQATSRYPAGDLSKAEAEAFEQHFFSCQQCSEELTAGAIFDENVRAVFHDRARVPEPVSPPVVLTGPSWLDRFRASFALPLTAMAGLLLGVVVYQNAFMLPGMRKEMAALGEPQPVSAFPLKIARESNSFHLSSNSPFWVAYFHLPDASSFPSYTCDIEKAGGVALKKVALPVPAAGQPFRILLRRSEFPSGTYVFKVRGQNSSTILATYTIDLSSS